MPCKGSVGHRIGDIGGAAGPPEVAIERAGAVRRLALRGILKRRRVHGVEVRSYLAADLNARDEEIADVPLGPSGLDVRLGVGQIPVPYVCVFVGREAATRKVIGAPGEVRRLDAGRVPADDRAAREERPVVVRENPAHAEEAQVIVDARDESGIRPADDLEPRAGDAGVRDRRECEEIPGSGDRSRAAARSRLPPCRASMGCTPDTSE